MGGASRLATYFLYAQAVEDDSSTSASRYSPLATRYSLLATRHYFSSERRRLDSWRRKETFMKGSAPTSCHCTRPCASMR